VRNPMQKHLGKAVWQRPCSDNPIYERNTMTKDEALALALEALEKHGAVPLDWACAECRPNSDMLKIGFQCRYHAAITAIKQAITLEDGKPATLEASAFTRENGKQAPEPVKAIHQVYLGDGWIDMRADEMWAYTPEQGWESKCVRTVYTQPAPKQAQEAPQFLANGSRFKLSNCGPNACGYVSFPKELSGRWVALVAADDDCHLKPKNQG